MIQPWCYHHVTQRPREAWWRSSPFRRAPIQCSFPPVGPAPGPCSRHSPQLSSVCFAVFLYLCFMHQASIQDQRPVFHDLYLLTLKVPGSRNSCRACAMLIQRVLVPWVGLEQGEGSRGGRDLPVTRGQSSRRSHRLTNRRSQSLDNHPESRQEVHPAIARVGGLGETESESEVAQSCPTLCNLPGSSVHGILQARILEWVSISFSRGSSQPRDRTWVSCIAGRRFNL